MNHPAHNDYEDDYTDPNDASVEEVESQLEGDSDIPEGYQRVTIKKQGFYCRAPYKAGHPLTEMEAKVLNQTRAENIRNNFAARMAAAAEKDPPEVLTQEDLEAYDQEYSFNTRIPRVGVSIDPVEFQERKLAAAALTERIVSKGHKVREYRKENPDKWEEYLGLLVKSGKFKTQALAIVAAQKAASTMSDNIDLEIAEAA